MTAGTSGYNNEVHNAMYNVYEVNEEMIAFQRRAPMHVSSSRIRLCSIVEG